MLDVLPLTSCSLPADRLLITWSLCCSSLQVLICVWRFLQTLMFTVLSCSVSTLQWPVCFGILSGELDPRTWCVHQSFNWPHQVSSPFSPIITNLDLEEVQRILVPRSESNPVVSVVRAPPSLSKLVPGASFVVCLNMFHGERKIKWCKHLYFCCKVGPCNMGVSAGASAGH